MKFVLFCEGHTEKQSLPCFLKKWLDPKLHNPVGIKVVKFCGWQEQHAETPKKVRLHTTDGDVIGVIGLMDLYGPTFYPNHLSTVATRYKWAKDHIEKKVKNPKFRQFFAVHETEAWLLSEPAIFPAPVQSKFPAQVQQPETVNFDLPPAKLLNKLYNETSGRNYKKVTHGKALFERANPDIVYQKCPYFKEMLDEMLKMAKAVKL